MSYNSAPREKVSPPEERRRIRLEYDFPRIVCLCGSTRFSKQWAEERFRLTLEGKIVLTIGCDTKSDDGLKLTEADKVKLDDLHLRKIDLADEVLILNVGGYMGDSTKRELAYARKLGKRVAFLEA